MPPALKAALERCRALALAALAGGAAGLGGDAPAAVDPGALANAAAAETAAWTEAQRARTPEAYQRYLELFPIGQHAEEAFRLLIERSFQRRPVPRLVDNEPAPGPAGVERTRVVAAAELALY